MKPSFQISLLALLCFFASPGRVTGQALASGSDKTATQLEALTKKMDEQNLKIDALSQQLLKMEKQISDIRPGVMIGEATPPASRPAATPPVPPAGGENTHVVSKGETLTSIARTYKVGVGELQKFNHIENDRALQIGQTIMIPTAGGTTSTPSPTPSPNE